jgi:hypothetical protein
MNSFKWPALFLLLTCFACSKPVPALEGLDLPQWKEDRNGCKSIRSGMRESIDREKEKLLSLDQMQIVDLLGKPDQNELYGRNQKFFYYFLGPAPACAMAPDLTAKMLVIRFNAMGLAKEVSIE